jgi:peptidoglycan/xylan/chitin deacetylase (PgdA/CDA1 family)
MTDRLACLTLDVEPDVPGNGGIQLFDDPGRFVWFRDTLRNAEAPLTAFVVMQHAERHALALAELAESGPLEFAIHSYSHDRNNTASHDEVRRARDVFVKLWGRTPEGYRAPYGLIDGDGLRTLMGEGFIYDSSIFPTLRIDEFGYNHLGYPRAPFIFTDGSRDLVEVPIAALRACRLIYSLSFVKLFGPATFHHLMRVFPLPDVVVVDFHPYDLYIDCIPHTFKPWKRFAHLRNASRAPEILVNMIETLRGQGYRFTSVGEVARRSAVSPSSRRVLVPR